MRVLIIGGTGNISSACTAALQDAGHDVGLITRGRSSLPSGCKGFSADRHDRAAMREVWQKFAPEVVINFLGYEVSDVQLDFELCAENVRQYLFISSATVYSKPPPRLPVTEESPLGNAHWPYAQKKLACEQWLLERRSKTGFPVTIVRPSHTYSERWVPNPISSSSYTFCQRLEKGNAVFVPDDGENPWTLTAASDFAMGLRGLVGNGTALGECFHITSDEVLTWNVIVAEIASALGVSAPQVLKVPTDFICQVAPAMTGSLKGDKSHPGVFDNSKIKRFVPGFTCPTSFHDGVRRSIDWLRTHPDQQNLSPAVEALCENVLGAWNSRLSSKA